MLIFEEGESIQRIVRRHYFVVLGMILRTLVMGLAPLVLLWVLFSDFAPLDPGFAGLAQNFISKWGEFLYSIWLLFLWVAFFVEWTDYYLDLWIITDKRIIDVEQIGFFNREVTSFRFEQIQDMTIETKGLIETFLKFGTLHIQTAGHEREIVIRDADHPEEARSLILRLSEKSKSTPGR